MKKIIVKILIIFLIQSSILSVKGIQQQINPVFDKITDLAEEQYEYYDYQNMTNLLHCF